MDFFGEPTRRWFEGAFAAPTPVQSRGWPVIAAGRHTLLVAPTGSGKTLAAFLWAIDSLLALPGDAPAGVRVVYVSPLKALVYDVERNLRAPLAGVARVAEGLGLNPHRPRVDVRTGDTPARERRRQRRDPGEILVTTPESLYLLLGSRAREHLRTVRTLIVDEVHALAPTKRGAHLALSLERVAELAVEDPQRIGLSATVRPVGEVARFLGGVRPVEAVDCAEPPLLDLRVCVPVPDMTRVPVPAPAGGPLLRRSPAREEPAPERGIWAALYPALLDLVRTHRSTLVFVNSRALAERLAQRLNDLAGEDLVRAHHGSLAPERRAEIEDALKVGRLRALVATSSLELGIDMGAVDLVVLVESPGSVARGLQRVGRAGHGVGQMSVARIFPKFRGDLLECTVVAGRMLAAEIESLQVPRSPLDVLSQQVVALCAERARTAAELLALARRSHPYRDLPSQALHAVLEMLSGGHRVPELVGLRPLLAWDRSEDRLSVRRGAELVARLNAGTIPDRASYPVQVGAQGPRVGELDEEMVFETRPGDVILLGASTWRVQEIGRDRVLVTAAPGEPGRLPFWRGEGPGRPLELGKALGRLLRELGARPPQEARRLLRARAPLDEHAVGNLVDYVQEQKAHTGVLPSDRAITVERFRDELGDWRICILSPWGARVHAPWAIALQRLLGARVGFAVQALYTDDGIVLRLADADEVPAARELFPDPEEVRELVTEQLADTALFAGLFRENAARALLLPRSRPERRRPLWAQRLKAQSLLAAVRGLPGFPLVLETYRQALGDVFDLPALEDLLRRVQAGEVRVDEVETRGASPFARSLVLAYVAAHLYEQDVPLAERRAQALTLDRRLLGELLGQAALRELLDPAALEEVERALQGIEPERQARDADEMHDLLRRLGDLSGPELAARCREDPGPWLARLEAARRVAQVGVAGERRWVAAEDVALYRDGLGVVPPPGLPLDLLAPVERSLERIVRRYASGHGPFLAREIGARLGLAPGQVEPVLRALQGEGVLVRGELRPGGVEPEWCDEQVLRRLRRATLARLRNQIAPLDARALGWFLPDWQGVGETARGPERLMQVVSQIEGLALPWSLLVQVLLPARVGGFRREDLDLLAAGGALVWVGVGPLGPADGRIALYRRSQAARLLPDAPAPAPAGAVHAAILEHLSRHGACFLLELQDAVRRALTEAGADELRTALWELVWAGRLTNDTFAPLQALGGGPRRAQALASGRWSLVDRLRDAGTAETERVLAVTRTLLERYGLVSREMAAAEGLVYGPIHRVLREMEATGRVQRGYFVEGLAGAQFALPGVVGRLRAAAPGRSEPSGGQDVVLLAAADPANPYGAVVPWPRPERADAGLRRVPGAWVVLAAGRPTLYVSVAGRQVHTFPGDPADLGPAFRALLRLPRAGRRGLLVIERVDGIPALSSPYAPDLRACGFVDDYRGLVAAP